MCGMQVGIISISDALMIVDLQVIGESLANSWSTLKTDTNYHNLLTWPPKPISAGEGCKKSNSLFHLLLYFYSFVT